MKQPLVNTLPSAWYLEDGHFQRELEAIWLKQWLFVGHVSEWPERGSYRVLAVGNQQLVVTRDREAQFHAFHNTCRHRGSRLCETSAGRFRGGRIVCPYHAWAYGLDGGLLSAPRMEEIEGFDKRAYGLYRIAVTEIDGFVFVNAGQPHNAVAGEALLEGLKPVQPWPTRDLAVAYQEQHDIACNWKVFWENFLECYHCPGVHPELCRIVPLYRESVSHPGELPDGHAWKKAEHAPRLREGAVTWSPDGSTDLPLFKSLDKEQQTAGMTFGDAIPSVYLVGHVDYFRTVRVMPVSAAVTQLTVTWYVHADTLATSTPDVQALTAFARQVVMEDARVAELNQQGLGCRVHEQGVLSPAEGDVAAFQNWVRDRLELSKD